MYGSIRLYCDKTSSAIDSKKIAAITLGKQLTICIFNTCEVKKAFAYYGKNMKNGAGKSIYKVLEKSFSRSGFVGLGINFLRSIIGVAYDY